MSQSIRAQIEDKAAGFAEDIGSLNELNGENLREMKIAETNKKTLRLIRAFRELNERGEAKFAHLEGLAAENPYFGIVPCRAAGIDFVMFHATDDVVTKRFLWIGEDGYETRMVRKWVAWCKRAGGDVLDIGAYSGLMSLLAAKCNPHNSIYLFEPIEAIAERANINVKLNGLSRRINRHNVAVSDNSGTQEINLFRDPNFLATGSSLQSKAGKEVVATKLIQTVRLDDDFSHLEPKVVKIDVEGHELSVLKGMQNMLSRCKPKIMIEVWEDTRDDVLGLLGALGYELSRVEKREARVNNYFAE